MPASRLQYLFTCYIYQDCSFEEENELMTLLDQPENEKAVQTLIDEVIENGTPDVPMPEMGATSILQNILQKDKADVNKTNVVPFNSVKPTFVAWRWVAAVAFFFLTGAAYFIYQKKDEVKTIAVQVAKKTVHPLADKNQAMLAMSDGTIIRLDTLPDGDFQYGSSKINKHGSLLVFQKTVSPDYAIPAVYNTLSIPRGDQYQVVLSDGSRVWLNAASSLRFPAAFKGSKRNVELTGEAYFEVSKNKQKPFQVKVGKMKVNVLGTHFNVNAYADEEIIRTSLFEGSVKITKGSESNFLKPGQQGILDKEKDKIKISKADMNEVMAWKNGLFQFEGSDITTIMREIGRWYDVEVIYEDKIPVRRFDGKISRKADLSEVLEILKLSNVKFSVEGKKIIVQ